MSHRRVATVLLVLVSAFLPLAAAMAQKQPNARSRAQSAASSIDPFPDPDTESGEQLIRGTVSTFEGHPVSNASVALQDLGRSKTLASVHSEANGTFVFPHLPPGRYEVIAGFGSDQASERVEISKVADTVVNLRLPEHASSTQPASANGATVSFAQYKVPAKARSLFEKAAQLMAHEKLSEALAKANAALAIFPRFPEALTLRGIVEEHNGKVDAALADFQQAIKIDASYPLSYIAMASALNSTGRFGESIPILSEVDRIAPNMWQTSYESARASLGKYDFQAAFRSIERASELRGGMKNDSAEIHLVRGYALLGLSKMQSAAGEIRAFLARKPDGPTADAARTILKQLHEPTMAADR